MLININIANFQKSIRVKYFIIGLVLMGICASCSKTEEGLIGEWEGTREIVNSKGELVESDISCIIKSESGSNRNVVLSVGGTSFEFTATEEMDILLYKDQPLGKDSSVMSYISGRAELQNDTLLHFDHDVYALKDSAFLYSDRVVLDMVRK